MDFSDILKTIGHMVKPNYNRETVAKVSALPQPSPTLPQPSPTITDEEQMRRRIDYAKRGYTRPNMTPEEIQVMPKTPQQKPRVIPTVQPRPSTLGASTQKNVIPAGTDVAMNYIKSQTPKGQDPAQYYPALGNEEFMSEVQNADKVRQGVANLLLMQGFMESTLGRNGNNVFGTKPGGEVSQFNDPVESVRYQLSDAVLGGGANPNMNILNEGDTSPLTLDRILQLYKSYDPPGAYVPQIEQVFGQR